MTETLDTRACVPEGVEHADILVGIPSYNNAQTIGHVVRAVQAGLTKYFGGRRAVILNSDGNSRDGTPDAVRQAALGDHQLLLISHPVFPIHRLTVPYHGMPGKGSAFRCIFGAARALGARACAVLDADLRSITPEWIQLLIQPILDGRFDYVAPYYPRHKYDGTITNGIVYPLTRALYGQRVRQPIGGDFGMSGELASHYLTRPVWETDVARYGIDIWMTTTAICDRYRVAQAFLGAKIHDAKDPGADLSDMLVQVVGTVFSLMETYADVWMAGKGSCDVPLLGFSFAVGLEPVSVDRQRMIDRFRSGVANLKDVWSAAIDADDLAELEKLARAEPARFRMENELWVRVVYALACAFHVRAIDREHLVRSSLPLYLGWVASFIGRVANSSAKEVDAAIEEVCLAFEAPSTTSGSGGRLRRAPHLARTLRSSHIALRSTKEIPTCQPPFPPRPRPETRSTGTSRPSCPTSRRASWCCCWASCSASSPATWPSGS